MTEWWKMIWRKRPLLGFIFSLFLLAGVVALGFYLLPLNDRWRLIAAIPGPVRRTGRVILRTVRDVPYLSYQFKNHTLPVYDLRIDRADLARLESNIPDANASTLTDEFKVPVPVTLIYGGLSYEGKIRYRGGSKVHWLWPKKSYRINFKKSQMFHGEEEIDLIIPYDRQYIVEQFQMYRAKKLGLTAPNTRFVAVTVNGRRPSVYWEVKLPGKSYLERQGLTGDANFYDSENLEAGSLYDSVVPWQKRTSDPRFPEVDRSDLAALLTLLNEGSDEDFNRHIFSLLDKDNFYSWSVHTLLAKSNHQDWAHNMRLYFDPSLGKFLILPWDVGVLYNYQDAHGHKLFEQSWNRLANRILANPVFMAERNARLWGYVRDEKNIQDDLIEYDRLFDEVRVALYQDKIRRFDNTYVNREVARFRRVLEEQFYFLRDLFISVAVDAEVKRVSPQSVQVTLLTQSLAPLVFKSVAVSGMIEPLIESTLVSAPDSAIDIDPDDFRGYENVKRQQKFLIPLAKLDLTGKKELVFHIQNAYTDEVIVYPVSLADL